MMVDDHVVDLYLIFINFLENIYSYMLDCCASECHQRAEEEEEASSAKCRDAETHARIKCLITNCKTVLFILSLIPHTYYS